jgi:hypothetical protein
VKIAFPFTIFPESCAAGIESGNPTFEKRRDI